MTDENKPVSKKPLRASRVPPPPEKMVHGTGSLGNVFRPKRNNSHPHWAKWKHMPEVELWEACALALNIAPDSMRRSPNDWMVSGADIFLPESFPSDDVAKEFKNLMEVAKANKQQTIHLKISLPEFAAWCATVVRDLTGRDIPPELAALTKVATQTATIEHEGRLRLEHDKNYQMVSPFEVDSIWHLTDSWSIDQACRLILLGYNEDIKRAIAYGFEHCPDGSTGRDRANALITIADRFMTIAKSSVQAGTMKEHDTPENWIKWAQSKGYSVAHLMPANAPATKEKGTTPGDDWREKARAIADSLALEKYQRGEREITARNTCDAVAIELAKDSTTHGIRGQRVAGSIRNEALKGWKFIPPTGTNDTSGTKK